MARKTKRDWLIAGTALLGQAGVGGLTIDAMCQELGLTKGSFYHHFADIEAFKAELLAFYENEGTLDIISRVETEATPAAKLHRLADIIVTTLDQLTTRPEVMVRAWALADAAARAVQERVDGRRRAYVTGLCAAITGDAGQAALLADLMYAILVGAETMQPPLSSAALRALFDEFFRVYGIE